MESAICLSKLVDKDNCAFPIAEEAKEYEKQEGIQKREVEESKEGKTAITKDVMFDEDLSIRSCDDFSAGDLEDAGLSPPPLLHS